MAQASCVLCGVLVTIALHPAPAERSVAATRIKRDSGKIKSEL
jgi:hypothetical protein